jgi:hypothetical protein
MSRLTSLFRGVVATAVIGAGLALSVAPAEAQWRRWHHGPRGGAIAAAAIGGLAAGALIAASRPAYGYGYGYRYAAPVYSAPVYSAPAYTYYQTSHYQPAYYQPAYATPVYRPYRPRPVYRQYVRYEPVCTVRRQKVWLGPNTYTFRRATVCR